MRFFEPVDKRQFGGWDMAYKQLESSEISYKTSISREQKQLQSTLMDGDLFSYEDDGMRALKTFIAFS